MGLVTVLDQILSQCGEDSDAKENDTILMVQKTRQSFICIQLGIKCIFGGSSFEIPTTARLKPSLFLIPCTRAMKPCHMNDKHL